MDYRCVYQILHQQEDFVIDIRFMRQQLSRDVEVSENFAHFPHQARRVFAERVHTMYQTHRCIHRIHQELTSDEYYQYLLRQGYGLTTLMLSAEPRSRRAVYYFHTQ